MVRRADILCNTITKHQDKATKFAVTTKHTFEDKKIDRSNVGFRMMETIGWKGGALGVKSDGITEPIG